MPPIFEDMTEPTDETVEETGPAEDPAAAASKRPADRSGLP